jgi:hypothetical protein
MDLIWKAKTAWNKIDGPTLPYRPEPGDGDGGGVNHIYNACRIGRALLNPNYGGPSCALPQQRCTDVSLNPNTCQVQFVSVPCPEPPWPPASSLPPPRVDPLFLDLDENGVQTTSLEGQTFFDHDGDGFAERTAWVAAGDGLLVMDRNGNGIIDDGRELFGNETILDDCTKAANGFQALSQLDSNHDGKIDANDQAFAQLTLQRDLSL